MEQRIAIVTGGNRGLGLEICRQLAQKGMPTMLTARDPDKGEAAARQLRTEGHHVYCQPLDVTKLSDIQALVAYVQAHFGRVDILVNNAGINLDETQLGLSVDPDTVRRTIETNVYGPLCLCQAIIPLMKRHNYGRIVNVASRMGQMASMGSHRLAYRISKTALNVITRVLAEEVRGSNILINSMSPGRIRTEMGGMDAPRSAAEGADTAVWLALLPDDGPTGTFFFERQPIPW
jgi:NAD(P)-dependent dehydrogenase (short-subunit alcohol dehydrogenase family)